MLHILVYIQKNQTMWFHFHKAAEYAAKIVMPFKLSKGLRNGLDYHSRVYSLIDQDEFKIGAKCVIFAPSRNKNFSYKLCSGWTAPYTIFDKISDIMYMVKIHPKGKSIKNSEEEKLESVQ